MQAIPKINIKDLKEHPMNTEIYGEEDIKELAEKIKESGWVKPLVITPNGTIISGHRRFKACQLLGIKEIEYEAVHFNNKNEELERLLLENQSREKTTYQKIQEGKFWEEVIKEKARLRMESGGVEKFPQGEIGKTRDIVAEKLGVGSGKTYEAAKKVVKEIDKREEKGDKEGAELLKATLNKSVNKALNIVKQAEPKEDNSVKSTKEEMRVCSKCGQEKSIHDFYEGRNQCIECCKSSRNPKDVYGNEIKIDKEKIKGIDIEAIIADVKDTNKNIGDVDGKSVAMEVSCSINMFIQNLGKYLEMEEQFEDMQNEDKRSVINSITNLEEVINKIKGFLY